MNTQSTPIVSPTGIWAALCLATILTTWVLSTSALDATTATLLTFAIVAWKVRLVFMRFMELSEVRRASRLVFVAWTVLTPIGIGIALASR